jgi:hypothetical protein
MDWEPIIGGRIDLLGFPSTETCQSAVSHPGNTKGC